MKPATITLWRCRCQGTGKIRVSALPGRYLGGDGFGRWEGTGKGREWIDGPGIPPTSLTHATRVVSCPYCDGSGWVLPGVWTPGWRATGRKSKRVRDGHPLVKSAEAHAVAHHEITRRKLIAQMRRLPYCDRCGAEAVYDIQADVWICTDEECERRWWAEARQRLAVRQRMDDKIKVRSERHGSSKAS